MIVVSFGGCLGVVVWVAVFVVLCAFTVWLVVIGNCVYVWFPMLVCFVWGAWCWALLLPVFDLVLWF